MLSDSFLMTKPSCVACLCISWGVGEKSWKQTWRKMDITKNVPFSMAAQVYTFHDAAMMQDLAERDKR
jgi:hypothetical protein